MRHAFFAITATIAFSLAALGDTGTPFPAGTNVEVGTPAGTVSGTLQDRIQDGWLTVLEVGQKVPTLIPERSVGFIRPDAKAFERFRDLKARRHAVPAAIVEHYVFGHPRVADSKRFKLKPFEESEEEHEGHAVLKRFAYTVGHYDKFKVPAWVAMRWGTENHAIAAREPPHTRSWKVDIELPPYARTRPEYEHSKFKYQRGHMARHEDLSGFGLPEDPRRGTRESCLMSNIVPQKQKGHTVWGRLEKAHHDIVADANAGIEAIWLIAGPVFENAEPEKWIGPDKVGAPQAVYKIIAWKTVDGRLTARGFIIPQEATGTDLPSFLKSIDEIEERTGLDFFPDMDEGEQEELESRRFAALWEDGE